MTKLSVFLLIIFILKMYEGLLFPTSQLIQWSPLIPGEIECNYRNRLPVQNEYFIIPAKLPILKDVYFVNGYFCNSVELVVRCDKGFFGAEDITFAEYHHPITEKDCLAGISQYLRNEIPILQYPPPDCSWLKVNREKTSGIVITPHAMLYDPYKNVIISELFPKMECKGHYCETVHPHKGWAPDANKRPECIASHLDSSVFYTTPNDYSSPEFWSPDMDIVNGQNICKISYCGLDGIKFHDGSWIGVVTDKIPKGATSFSEFWKSLTLCSKTEFIADHDRYYSEHVAARTGIQEFFHVECLRVKSRLISGEHISRVDLQALTPTSPGLHRVYRFVNDTIEMGVSEYKDVKLMKPTATNPIIVHTHANETVFWPYWTIDKVSNIIDGPNGIFISNGTVMVYLEDSNNYIKALSLSLKSKYDVKPLGYYHDKPEITSNNGTYTFKHVSDKSFGQAVEEFFEGIGYGIAKWLMIFAGGTLLTMILCSIIKTIKNRPKPRPMNVYYKP